MLFILEYAFGSVLVYRDFYVNVKLAAHRKVSGEAHRLRAFHPL